LKKKKKKVFEKRKWLWKINVKWNNEFRSEKEVWKVKKTEKVPLKSKGSYPLNYMTIKNNNFKI